MRHVICSTWSEQLEFSRISVTALLHYDGTKNCRKGGTVKDAVGGGRFALMTFLLLSACATKIPQTPAPRGEGEMGTPYVIRVGDVLDVRFYKTPELNVEVPVRSDGKISLDPIGDIQAAGLSPEALSKALSKKYAGELTDPRVTVIVRQ